MSFITNIEGSHNTLLRNIYELTMDNNSIISNLSEKYHCSNIKEFVKSFQSVVRMPLIIEAGYL